MVKKIISKKMAGTAPQQPAKGKKCHFCQNSKDPSYMDFVTLRRFTTDRAKIIPRTKGGVCSKHQRVLTRQIKYARHLSLLPFAPKV